MTQKTTKSPLPAGRRCCPTLHPGTVTITQHGAVEPSGRPAAVRPVGAPVWAMMRLRGKTAPADPAMGFRQKPSRAVHSPARPARLGPIRGTRVTLEITRAGPTPGAISAALFTSAKPFAGRPARGNRTTLTARTASDKHRQICRPLGGKQRASDATWSR